MDLKAKGYENTVINNPTKGGIKKYLTNTFLFKKFVTIPMRFSFKKGKIYIKIGLIKSHIYSILLSNKPCKVLLLPFYPNRDKFYL